ncbi:MAG TPA: hypothetical protein VGG97_07665 [Bryobacteraceae bacterium]|jgi:hypothetical protein
MAGTDTPSLRIRDWDAATKFAGIAALLAGGIWSVWINHQTAKQQASAAQIEAQKPFSSRRLEIYEKLANLTSAVAQADLPPQIRKAKRQELDQIVNGPLALVAQEKIFSALLDFYSCLDGQHCTKGTLMLYSRNVARACRSSIEESWSVSLPPVPSSDRLP